MKVLIVDDEPTSRMILGATLKKLGYEVQTAIGGRQAWELFANQAAPIVISDMVMPEGDGLELCERIRASNRPQYTYILLLTSVGSKTGYLDGMRAGADDFITKPFDEDVLVARLAVAERILNLQIQVKQLSGLLPICSLCKKVRDDQNYWHQVESFVTRHSGAKFTHNYCPDCFHRLKREIETSAPVAHTV